MIQDEDLTGVLKLCCCLPPRVVHRTDAVPSAAVARAVQATHVQTTFGPLLQGDGNRKME